MLCIISQMHNMP